MPKYITSSYEDATHLALFGFHGRPANLVVSVLDPDSDAPDFRKGALLMGCDHQKHVRLDLYDAMDPTPSHGGIDEHFVDALKELAASIHEDDLVLVRCKGGISRSPATAISLMAIRAGLDWPLAKAAVSSFLKENTRAVPNALLVREVDRLMGYSGKFECLVREQCGSRRG